MWVEDKGEEEKNLNFYDTFSLLMKRLLVSSFCIFNKNGGFEYKVIKNIEEYKISFSENFYNLKNPYKKILKFSNNINNFIISNFYFL